MQLFLRCGSSHVWVVEGACARPSVHTPPAFARKDAQDTPAFPNQLLTPGVPSVLLRLCKDLVSHVVPKTDGTKRRESFSKVRGDGVMGLPGRKRVDRGEGCWLSGPRTRAECFLDKHDFSAFNPQRAIQ